MASEEYFNRQVNKQKYGGGAPDFDFNLTHQQRQKLKTIETYYPSSTKNTKQTSNTNSNYNYSDIDSRSKLIVYGAIGLFVVFFLAVNGLVDWLGNSPFKKLDSGETFVFVSAIICFFGCIVQCYRIFFRGQLNGRITNYSMTYFYTICFVFLVSIVIIALFIIWAIQMRNNHLG